MADSDVRDCMDRVVAAVAAADRSQATVRRYQQVLERFAVFLAGRGLATAGEQMCIDFIADCSGVRLGWSREPVGDRTCS